MLVRQFRFAADSRQYIGDALQQRRDLFFQGGGAFAQRSEFGAEIGLARLCEAVHRHRS
ncbi:hypothetical protein BURMUCGD1_6496 [Burkholderia multivorans CGD1]|nr:hypothetical protein BURMUCGD1_6496 [Burkholderia multivorans CGD1]